jgi:D-glycero-D-manno-heptose 1,7-bisphosphate phosphatase
MLLDAARKYQLDLAASWMIGDSEVDVEAGRNAGCKTARLLESDVVEDKADVVASSLHEVIDRILRLEKDAGLIVAGSSY